jgi:hypothetical protein
MACQNAHWCAAEKTAAGSGAVASGTSSWICWWPAVNRGQCGAGAADGPALGVPVAANRLQYWMIWSDRRSCAGVNGGRLSRIGNLWNTYCSSVLCPAATGKVK